jgi:hypothetical protein
VAHQLSNKVNSTIILGKEMKKNITFIGGLMLFSFIAAGCQESSEVVSPYSALKSNPENSGFIPVLTLSVPQKITADESFSVRISTDGAAGILQLQILEDNGNLATTEEEEQWLTVAETDCETSTELTINGLPAGIYVIRAHFVPSECTFDSRIYSSKSEHQVIEVIEKIVYEGLALTGEVLSYNSSSNMFEVKFNVNPCSQSYNSLKLQGGLVAKTGSVSGVPEPTNIKELNQNFIITWDIGNVTTGFNEDYIIRYKYIPEGNNGDEVQITGNWSVEGFTADGTPVTVECPPVKYVIGTLDINGRIK